MGIYYYNIACVGFYKKKEKVIYESSDKSEITLPENIKTNDDDKGTLYYIESATVKYGSMDRIIDENDLNRGHILLTEAKQILKFNNDVEDEDMLALKKLEEQLNPEHKIDSYLVEYVLCTMETPFSSSCSLIMPII